MTATPTPTSSYTQTRRSQIDTGAPSNGNTAPTGWNNWSTGSNPPANLSLLDTSSTATGWTISTGSGWTYANSGTQTGNNSGVYPDAVINSNWYTGNNTSNPMLVTISGLNNSRFYDITAMGSRNGTTDRGTTFIVGSDQRNQIADNNTANVTTFAKVAPSSGSIVLKVATGLGSSNTNVGFGYLSAIVITEFTAA